MNSRLTSSAVLLVAAAGLAVALEPTPKAAGMVAAPTGSMGALPTAEPAITVTATGTASAVESFFSITSSVSGNDEAADVAVQNFAQARLRVVTALEGAGIDGLTIEGEGLKMNYTPDKSGNEEMAFMMGDFGGGDADDPGVTCKEAIDIRFRPADGAEAQTAQIADAVNLALELGLKLKGSSPANPFAGAMMVAPGISTSSVEAPAGTVGGVLDAEAKAQVERDAMTAAMARARALGTQLAGLSGRELGSVVEVTLVSMGSEWKGIGSGVEATATVKVSFAFGG